MNKKIIIEAKPNIPMFPNEIAQGNKKAISKFKKQNLIKYPIGHTPYIEIPEMFNNDLISFIENH